MPRTAAFLKNTLGLVETSSADSSERTQLNVLWSDATLIFSRGALTGGSRLTARFADNHLRPYLHIDLVALKFETGVGEVRKWLRKIECKTLNIAGPPASAEPAIYDDVLLFLASLRAAP